MQENHKRFADKYFETLNAKESAIYAGFSEDTAKQQGWQLLQREDIDTYLSELKQEYSIKSGITKQWVMERFKGISDNSFETGDSSGANKATEMLGKMIGAFEKDNEQSKTTQKTVINLGNGTNHNETTS